VARRDRKWSSGRLPSTPTAGRLHAERLLVGDDPLVVVDLSGNAGVAHGHPPRRRPGCGGCRVGATVSGRAPGRSEPGGGAQGRPRSAFGTSSRPDTGRAADRRAGASSTGADASARISCCRSSPDLAAVARPVAGYPGVAGGWVASPAAGRVLAGSSAPGAPRRWIGAGRTELSWAMRRQLFELPGRAGPPAVVDVRWRGRGRRQVKCRLLALRGRWAYSLLLVTALLPPRPGGGCGGEDGFRSWAAASVGAERRPSVRPRTPLRNARVRRRDPAGQRPNATTGTPGGAPARPPSAPVALRQPTGRPPGAALPDRQRRWRRPSRGRARHTGRPVPVVGGGRGLRQVVEHFPLQRPSGRWASASMGGLCTGGGVGLATGRPGRAAGSAGNGGWSTGLSTASIGRTVHRTHYSPWSDAGVEVLAGVLVREQRAFWLYSSCSSLGLPSRISSFDFQLPVVEGVPCGDPWRRRSRPW